MGVVWTVKGGRSGEYEPTMVEHGLVGGNFGVKMDLANAESLEAVRDSYFKFHSNDSQNRAAQYAGQLWSLVHRMAEHELVVLRLKTTGTIAVGRVSGGYQYRTDLDGLLHVRPVNWISTEIEKDAFDQDLLYSFGAFATVAQVHREHSEERIVAAVEGKKAFISDVGSVSTAENSPDIAELAREQVRQAVTQGFAGHDLAGLVGDVLAAQGLTRFVSEPGADLGIDIFAGSGPLGMDSPRIIVQVKTGQASIDDLRALRGLLGSRGADQGLLVAWGGFKGSVRREARSEYFQVRLWDADDLLDMISSNYEALPEEVRSKLPLKRVWALVPEAP